MGPTLPRWSLEELDDAVRVNRVVVVELRSESCPYCGPQEGVLLRLNEERAEALVIGSVDVNDHAEVVEKFEITGLPTILFFSDGSLTQRIAGFRRAPELRPLLRALLGA